MSGKKKYIKLVCFFDIDVLIFMEKNAVLCLLQEAVLAVLCLNLCEEFLEVSLISVNAIAINLEFV